jgi:hypothetical protein
MSRSGSQTGVGRSPPPSIQPLSLAPPSKENSFYKAYGNVSSKKDASKHIADCHVDPFFNDGHNVAPLPRQEALNFMGKRVIPYRGVVDASRKNTDGFEHLNTSSQKLTEKEKLHTSPIKRNFLL